MKKFIIGGVSALVVLLGICGFAGSMDEEKTPAETTVCVAMQQSHLQTEDSFTDTATETETASLSFSTTEKTTVHRSLSALTKAKTNRNFPEYTGEAYSVLNDNVPDFQKSDLTEKSFEKYSKLDSLGRCGVAYANIGKDIMPTEERGSIGSVKPSGWHTVKYDCVDGKYLYNRCHLIGFQLSGENANTKNLITGTRYMNVEGMLPFENMVADYVKETGNHVLYRVTPVFEGNHLVASGVEMEAYSVEDDGNGICFHVYCFNVQPNVVIDYATGNSSLQTTKTTAKVTEISKKQTAKKETTAQKKTTEKTIQTAEDSSPKQEYILNTNTKKFHYPNCASVKKMNEENKENYCGTREEIIHMGYDPCGYCHP